jgi:hypothetical protein
MNTRKAWTWMMVAIALVLAGCGPRLRVGELRTESQSVELGDATSVRVEIQIGAGDLKVTGGAEKLMEADFTYNVAKLKPEVEYTDGTLVVQQPDVGGFPALQGIADFRNEWDLRLDDGVPMDLRLNMGAGNSDLQLAGLALTGLNLDLGAGISIIDLSGDWASDLDATIETGAADITVRLPRDVGIRVEVEAGPTAVSAPDFSKDGNVYTNAAYGESDVTLRIVMQAGVGLITLELE